MAFSTDSVAQPTLQQELEATARHLATVLPEEANRTIDVGIVTVQQAGLTARALRVGQTAPDFTLPDAYGARITLYELLRQGPVVVVFYRGNWCPYCNLQLRAYQQVLLELAAYGATLVAVSPQKPELSALTSTEKDLQYPVLSDVGNAVAREYGLAYAVGEDVYATLHGVGIDLQTYNGDASGELPLTATFVIRPNGVVAWATVDANFKRRPDPTAILAALAAL